MPRTPHTPPALRRVARVAAPALVLPLVLGLGGCGAGSPESAETTQSPAPESASPSEPAAGTRSPAEDKGDGSGANAGTIEITVEGGSFDPTGERVEATVGEELVLEITSDAPGELHVHSIPEQYVTFGRGTTSASIPIEQPGIIEVEDHGSGAVILQVEAR
jgi:hypothetical protein